MSTTDRRPPHAQNVALRSRARDTRTEVLHELISALRRAKDGTAEFDRQAALCRIVAVFRAELCDRMHTERAIYQGFYLRALDSAREWREAGNPFNALVALEHAARFRAVPLVRPARAEG